MKTKTMKLLCLLLAGLMLLSTLAACGNETEGPEDRQTTAGSANEEETVDEIQAALDALESVDWGGEDFAVLYNAAFKNEVYGEYGTVDKENGASQVIINIIKKQYDTLFQKSGKKIVTLLLISFHLIKAGIYNHNIRPFIKLLFSIMNFNT
jgi:hypothetical protein